MKFPGFWTMAAVVALVGVGIAAALADDSWIGRRVLTKFGTVLRVEDRVVDDEGRAASLAGLGVERKTERVYRVERTSGKWLWIQDEKGGACGWVKSQDIVPLEQSVAFYTDEIKAAPEAHLFNARGFARLQGEDKEKAIADFDEAIRLAPGDSLYYISRGYARDEVGQYDEAIADYSEAIRLNPKDEMAYVNRAVTWINKEEYDKAIADCDEAIRLDPKDGSAHLNRGNAWSRKGEYEKAIGDYHAAILIDPKDPLVYNSRGVALKKLKEYKKAIADFAEAIRLDPADASTYYNRGNALGEMKEYEKAIIDYDESIHLDPEFKWAYLNRGTTWRKMNEPARAIADFAEVIRLDPDEPAAYSNRAWLWATCTDARIRDGKRALESATRACELSDWKDTNDLGILAACYAETGEFDKAVEWQEKAIALHGDQDDKDTWVERLGLYREKKPFRDNE